MPLVSTKERIKITMLHEIGIIGFGGMAGHHVKQTRTLDFVKVKGVYDINPDRMEAAKAEGLIAYSSLDALLADEALDIVVVAVPNHLHRDYCIRALRAGKHVLCEKPVTLTSEELCDIMRVAEETGKVFTIDQNRRVNRDFVLMRRQVESGLLGDVYVIESRVEGSRGMPAGWRTDKAQGGGMMLDWGVHLIDQILYMYPSAKVTNVFCKMYSVHYADVDDNFRLTMTLDNGVTAHIEVSTNNFLLHPRWYVLGTDGTLQIDGWEATGKIVRCKTREDTWGTEIAKNKVGPSKTMAPRSPESQEVINLDAPGDVEDNLNPTYRQMVDAIEGRAPLAIRPEEALRVMRVMELSFESARTNQAIHTSI